jgi:hypothetical protein
MLQIIHANLHRWWVIEDIWQKAGLDSSSV